MRLFSLYIVFSIVFSISLKAQFNYVPNGSFELHDSCPKTYSSIDFYCSEWFTPTSKMILIPIFPYSINGSGSSDYYNTCSSNQNIQIPKNSSGYQNSINGNAYAGIIFQNEGNNVFIDYKEYLEIRLNKKLSKNREYCIEFHYSIAERFDYIPNSYYPIELGALLTDTLVYRLSGINTQQPQNIYVNPQVSQQLPQTIDTINWIKVSGSFIAKGGEQYLTIGNFQHTDTLTDKSVYVYIDDVKLYYCGPDTTPQEADSMIIPNVFTPNDDGYNDKFEYENQEQWEYETQIFGRWGNLVFDNNNSKNWDGFYKNEKVSPGVYFYVIKAVGIRNGEIRIYRGTVTVMY